MRRAWTGVLVLFVFFSFTASAQSAPNGRLPAGWLIHILEYPHIRITPVADASFSAVMVLDAGSSRSYEQVARDGKGRVFEEIRTIAKDSGAGCMPGMDDPENPCGGADPWVTALVYIDPTQHTAYECITKGHQCHALNYDEWAAPAADLSAFPRFQVVTDSLGTKKIDGMEAVGTREHIHVRPLPGVAGSRVNPNWAPTREIWYSPALQIDLLIKTTTSSITRSSVQIKALKRAEPNPSLFVPSGKYKFSAVEVP